MASPAWLLILFLASFSLTMNNSLSYCKADPTDGFTSLGTKTNFAVQKPYNVPLNHRYSFVNGVHKMWVYATDKPFEAGSPTAPRTELRFIGYDYSSGIWQFEGYVFVPKGTTGVSIMQIHRTDGQKPATNLMLMVFDGELRVYSKKLVESNIYDRWMRVNIIHDVEADNLTIFINGVQKLKVNGRGKGSKFYFKCGVYGQHDESRYMESRWSHIKIYKKD